MVNSEVRRLAAIMFSDIVGYTSMMDNDEEGTREILQKQRELIFPLVESYGGKVLKEMGDGLLLMFDSANNAVKCAIDIQNLEKEFSLRLGIHIGDVVIEKGDVFGAGVNIASRVESLTPSGSICITADVKHQISNLKGLNIQNLGFKSLKGVKEPVEVFEIIPDRLYEKKEMQNSGLSAAFNKVFPLQTLRKYSSEPKYNHLRLIIGITLLVLIIVAIFTRLKSVDSLSGFEQSVAVLPLENLSPNPDDAFFTDGVHEDIIIHLARIEDLKVIARSSVISYQPGAHRDIRKIAGDLGVNSVLEGSVRRSGERIRVAVSLIDVQSNRTLWAEIFERNMADIFAIQGEIASEIASALQVSIRPAVQEYIDRKPTNNPEAYDLYLRAREFDLRPGYILENMEIAERLYKQALEKDPEFALAYAKLSILNSTIYWFMADYSDDRVFGILSNAEKALEIVPDLAEGFLAFGYYYYWVEKDYSKAIELLKQVQQLQPNDSELIHTIGAVQRRMGNFEESIVMMERAIQLNPRMPSYMYQIALTNVYLRNYEAAYHWFDRALSTAPDFYIAEAGKYTSQLMITGDLEQYRSNLQRLSFMEYINPDIWWYYNIIGRNIDYLIELARKTNIQVFDSQDAYHPMEFVLGLLHRLNGNDEVANVYLHNAVDILKQKILENPADFRAHSTLGRVYALQGKYDEASELGEKIITLVPEEKDALLHIRALLDRAQMYTYLKDAETSVILLEELLNRPSNVSVNYLKILPDFDFIRDTPEFKDLIRRYE